MFTLGFASVGCVPDVAMISTRGRHADRVIAHMEGYTTVSA